MRTRLAAHLALLAFLLWLYGGDLWRSAQLARAPFAALAASPHVPLAVVGLVVCALGVGLWVAGLRRGPTWRGRALFPAAAALVLLVDFGVLSSGRPAVPFDLRVDAAVAAVVDGAQELATPAGVPVDVAQLTALAAGAGAPPFFVGGEPLGAWTLELVRGCAGPALESAGRAPGTLVYCVAPDRQTAWVSGVTLDGPFGQPRVRAGEGAPGRVVAPPPEREAPDEPPPPAWGEPAP